MVRRSAARWFVDVCAVETRIAKLIGERLVSLKIIPHVMPGLARPQVGDIYLVRVAKSARGMSGLFVDLGEGGEGLLRTKETSPEGEFVLARVTQSAYGSKRTVLKLEKATAFELEGERRARRLSPPMSAAQYLAARRLEGEVISVDSDEAWRGPPSADNAEIGLFERDNIEAQIEAALDPVVVLPCGGRLIIEQTQALTAIDVDAGTAARVGDVNAQAAAEVAYQVAVRGLAGNIVIDFAQINRAAELGALKQRIAGAAAEIGVELRLGGAGRTGLLELQRSRAEAPLAALLSEGGVTHSAVPVRWSLEAQAARLARAVRLASARMPGALELHIGVPLGDWLRAAGRPAWEAIVEASPAPLHLIADGLDDGVAVERSRRSAR